MLRALQCKYFSNVPLSDLSITVSLGVTWTGSVSSVPDTVLGPVGEWLIFVKWTGLDMEEKKNE